MPNPNDLFEIMVKEAMEEVSHGWRDANDKAVTLAAFGLIAQKIDERVNKLVKPAWLVGISVAGSAIFFIISKVMGL